MIEKHIVLEDIDPVIFYGVNNANMQMIKALYPKLRIVARGNVIKVMGDEEEMCAFEESILTLEKHCAQYNSLKEEVILDIVKGRKPQVEKTGDTEILSAEYPFLAGEELEENEHDRYQPLEVSTERGTVLEHCRRALMRVLARGVGAHGLLLIGTGDWNDALSLIHI